MQRLSFNRRVRTLQGSPISGWVLSYHPDRINLTKGYYYYQEYELIEGLWSDFVNKIRDFVWKTLEVFKNKDGNPACEIVWIGSDTEKKRAFVQFRVKDEIDHIEGSEETLNLMNVPLIPIIPILTMIIGGIIGFLFGVALGVALIIAGILIGGDLGSGLAMIGIGALVFILFPGFYKLFFMIPTGAGFYLIARYFKVV